MLSIFLILALAYLASAVLEAVTKRQYYPRVSQRLGLKYTNTSGDTYNGTLDQRTYTTWKGLKIVKRKVITMTNPNSDEQAAIRSYIESLSKLWTALTAPKKALWEAAANVWTPSPNPEAGVRAIIRRPKGPLSGYNLFMLRNVRRYIAGAATVLQIPAPPVGPVVMNTAITADFVVPGVLTVAWTDANPLTATAYMAVWGTFVQAGVGHRQLLGLALSSAGTIALGTFKSGLGLAVPWSSVVGTPILVQCEVVDQVTGYYSAPSATLQATVA